MIPILLNHDHDPKSIIGRIDMDGSRLIATFHEPMLQDTFDAMFPGAGYALLEYEECEEGTFLTRVAIIEFSLVPLAPAAPA